MLPALRLASARAAHCETVAAQVAEQLRRDEEIASVRTAITTLDQVALTAYGQQNGLLARRSGASDSTPTAATRVKPMITAGRMSRSRTV